MGKTKYNLTPIYLINFIGSLGFSIVVPFLVFLNGEFGGNAFIFGILLAMYSLFQIPGATILGNLSDRIGRKKVLIQLEGAELLIHSLPKCQRAGTETQQFTYAQLKAREVAKSFNM